MESRPLDFNKHLLQKCDVKCRYQDLSSNAPYFLGSTIFLDCDLNIKLLAGLQDTIKNIIEKNPIGTPIPNPIKNTSSSKKLPCVDIFRSPSLHDRFITFPQRPGFPGRYDMLSKVSNWLPIARGDHYWNFRNHVR
jgi:hypothetical protein